MIKKHPQYSIRQFGLYINGLRVPQDNFKIKTNPFSGKVVDRVFLIPQDSLVFDEQTPTEEVTPLHS